MESGDVSEKPNSLEKPEGCSYCGAADVRLLRCSRCKLVFYCNQSHQRLHWSKHKPSCRPVTDQLVAGAGVGGGDQHIGSKTASVIKTTPLTPTKESHSFSKYTHSSQSLPLYAVREFDMSFDDYVITNSPSVHKLSPDDQLNRDSVLKSANIVVEKMLSEGYCVLDNFLGDSKASKVLWDVTNICRSGIMKPGQLVTRGRNDQGRIRGDIITWITGKEEAYEHMKLIMSEVDRLIRYCSGRLGNVKGRTPAMVACYPANGAGYIRHIDNTTRDGRILSCLYYLNKGWQPEEFGGNLRLFPFAKQEYVNIEPIFDRFCIFWADRRTPHEVMPSFHQRFAVTLWFFEAQERNQLKENYFSKLKNAFASNVSVNPSERNLKDKKEEEEAYKRIPTSSSTNEDEEDDEPAQKR